MLRVVITFLLLLSMSFAQTQTPKSIDTVDYRNDKVVFSVQFTEGKKTNEINFSSNADGAFHLRHHEEQKLVKSKKISSENAQKIDENFVDKFITMKYMMDHEYKLKCENTSSLSMRGEDLSVCDQDSKRKEILNELISALKENLI